MVTPTPPHPLKILVAEDHVVNQKIILHILGKFGHTAVIAANGIQVLEALEREHYDIIFMDVHMPEMDGLETTRRIINKWKTGERPKIIAITADAMAGDREKCVEAGMDDYIGKPIRIEDVETILDRWGVENKLQKPSHQNLEDADQEAIEQSLRERVHQLGLETDAAFTIDLIETFLTTAETQVKKLLEAFQEKNLRQIHYLAHSLKGNSFNIGAKTLGTLSATIEDHASAGHTEDFERIYEEIQKEFVRTRQALTILQEKMKAKGT